MPKKTNHYPAAYRRQIIELHLKGRSIGELAAEFEPSEQTIRNWIAQHERDQGTRSDGLNTSEREELRRLRQENRRLREEREILKKATAFFVRETKSGTGR